MNVLLSPPALDSAVESIDSLAGRTYAIEISDTLSLI